MIHLIECSQTEMVPEKPTENLQCVEDNYFQWTAAFLASEVPLYPLKTHCSVTVQTMCLRWAVVP